MILGQLRMGARQAKNAPLWLILLILKEKPEKEAIVKENSVLGVNLGDVLLWDADVARGVGVHRLLLALQHKLLMVHLSNVHLFICHSDA